MATITPKWNTSGVDEVIEKVDKLNSLLKETHKLIYDLQTNYDFKFSESDSLTKWLKMFS